MAITLNKITGFLNEIDFNFEERDENTIVTSFSKDDDSILIVIRLMEDGEFCTMRTVKHLDELVAEAPEDKRNALLSWMLEQNYNTKVGVWEYDPSDHEVAYVVDYIIEDGDVTDKQFMRGFGTVVKSVEKIAEMKAVLGLAPAMDDKERKKQELLRQLRELEGDSSSAI